MTKMDKGIRSNREEEELTDLEQVNIIRKITKRKKKMFNSCPAQDTCDVIKVIFDKSNTNIHFRHIK